MAVNSLLTLQFVRAKRLKKTRVVAVGIIAVVTLSSLLLLLLPSPPTESRTQLAPWAFPGAYANYTGSTMLFGKFRYTMNYAIKVLAVTGTQAEVLSQVRYQIGSDSPIVLQHSSWHNVTKDEDTTGAFIANGTLLYSYDANVTIRGKTIPVVVDGYEHFGSPDFSMMAWRSKAIGLPVQLRFSLGNLASVTLPLAETNIPGLLPQESVSGNSA